MCLAQNYFTPVFILVEATAPTTLPWSSLHSFFYNISCASIFIGLLAVFNLPAVVNFTQVFRIRDITVFSPAAVIFSTFHLRSAHGPSLPCFERRELSSGTTHRCQLIITASAITTSPPGDSPFRHRVVSPATPHHFSGNSPPCSRLQLILRAPHRVERRFASALFSCSFFFDLLFYLRVVLQPLHSPERRIF